MKNISSTTDNAPFVERLKPLTSALFHFLDWFTPTHPFITDKRARNVYILKHVVAVLEAGRSYG